MLCVIFDAFSIKGQPETMPDYLIMQPVRPLFWPPMHIFIEIVKATLFLGGTPNAFLGAPLSIFSGDFRKVFFVDAHFYFFV